MGSMHNLRSKPPRNPSSLGPKRQLSLLVNIGTVILTLDHALPYPPFETIQLRNPEAAVPGCRDDPVAAAPTLDRR